MKKPAVPKANIVTIIVLCMLIAVITVQSFLSSCSVQANESTGKVQTYATPDTATADEAVLTASTEPTSETSEPTTQKSTEKPTKPEKDENTEPVTKKKNSADNETTQPSTQKETVQWATVMTMETKCSYEEQWEKGYLVAIDYPDKTYQTYHIDLTDEDRDVLEHLCTGEFEVGGFIGEALIAQCVKDAMCFDGYKTVEDVRVKCGYAASLDNTPTQEVKNAVSYIFDQDHAAVQHRIMYMYNPSLVSSAFHESQNYILTYEGQRFFDRWGY
ncbi:MAG: hypothetical protein PUD24_01630 [Oscillospiraceae bacterium]|nr:hypothetical protein [Oscillospiraceae bacterium]